MNRKKLINLIGILVVFVIFFIGLIFQVTRRKDQLENNYFISIARVVSFETNQRKGLTTNKHVLKYRFWDGQQMLEKIENIEIGEYYTDSINVGDLYIMKVSKVDSGYREIFFNMKVDSKTGLKIPSFH